MEHQGGHRGANHHQADLPRFPKTEDDGGPDRGAGSGGPRWGLVLGIIVAIALVGLIILHLTGVSPGIH